MKLLELKLKGLRTLHDGTYSFTAMDGAPHDVVLLAGTGAAGKTSLLEVIVAAKESVGSWGRPNAWAHLRRRGVQCARIEAHWRLTESETDEAQLKSTDVAVLTELEDDTVRAPDCPIGLRRLFQAADEGGLARIAYFHAERQLTNPRNAEAAPFLALLRDSRKHASLIGSAVDLLVADQARMARTISDGGLVLPGERTRTTDLREHLRPFLPRLGLASFTIEDGAKDLVFHTQDGDPVRAARLSSSERQALLLALDAFLYERSSGVILLDCPELHQHPSEHVALFTAYREAVRRSQIIAATSSATLLRSGAHVLQLPISEAKS